MQPIYEFLASLAAKGVKLSLDGDRLNCYAERGVVTEEIGKEIVRLRPHIVALLGGQAAKEHDSLGLRQFPLSAGERGLYVLQQLAPESSTYNVPMCFRTRQGIQLPHLARAWQLVQREFPILTARIVETGGRLSHDLDPACVTVFTSETVDIADDSAFAEFLRARVGRPFDLKHGPLTRPELFVREGRDATLLITAHHIVIDGISTVILLRALFSHYQALCAGRLPVVVAAGEGYDAFVAWEEAMLASAEGRAHRDYWKTQLAGIAAEVTLPALSLSSRPADRAARVIVEPLPEPLAQRITALSRSAAVPPSAIFLAAFQLLLHRVTGQDDLVVTMPVMGRAGGRFRNDVGYFINMAPLRSQLAAPGDFADWMRQAQRTLMDALYHSPYPLPRIVSDLNLAGAQAGNLFRIVYAYQNVLQLQDVTRAERSGVNIEMVGEIAQEGVGDLELEVFGQESGTTLHLKYLGAVVDTAMARKLVGHFLVLLDAVAADPHRPVLDYPLLDCEEREKVLYGFNATARTYPQAARLVHELFEDQAARRPDGVAVSFGDDVLNYRQLDERANRLAHHLIACGVAPDERVAVYMERSLDLFVALLAVMKAGGAYVPLDPDYPADRIAYMLGDSGPKAVLTQAVLRDRLPEVSIPVVVVDVDADIAARPAAKPMVPGLGPANLAYVIYTSGSTGLPKGAMNEHRAVVNRLLWIQDRYPLTAEDRLLQKTAFGFDVSVGEFFWPMLAGARLVMAPPGLHRDPDALADLIEQCGITAVHFVPSMLRIFLDRLSPDRCPSIRHLSCSGEELPMASVQRCRSLLPGATVLNLYGPTEAAIEVSAWDCRDSGAEHRVPIGRPIANTRLYVLDPRGQPVPIGVAGELFIGGTQVCRGYLNRPKLTHERFVPDPFAGRAGARMYKTGDLVRWLADGSLDYLGRNDFQVKLRGFRIELGEIEARLAACAGIGDAVVLAREDVPGDKRLVAYVTAEEGAELDIEALRHQLSVSLPDYMVPSAYVLLAELPLTPNGKMDRKALPAPDGNAYASRSYEAPAGADEVMLAAIWRELLGVEQVGVHDGFFDLGGHSLLATQLVARVRKDFGVELPLRVVFEARTVREQAGQIEELRRLKTGVAQPRLVALPRDERSLPSYAQERLWFLDQLDPGSAAYNLPLALRIEGPLDGSALERSLGALVLRHESLRTRFETVEGACVQVIDEAGRFVLSRLDLSGLTPPEQEAEVRRLATAEAARPFDLAAGPLLRSCLLRLSDADHVLLFTMHHIISDGWSMGVASRELGALYAAHVAGLPSPLAPLPVQYADYALWQRSWLTGEVLERQVAYWRERLIGAPTALELPADRPRPALSSHRGVRLPIALSASLSAELAKLAHREGATLFMVLLTVYQLLLSRWSGQEDVVVGSPIAGRTVLESEGLIGFFVNILAHRLNLSGDPSFTELLVRNREHVLGAFDHQEVPFERLVQELRIERDLSRQPLFQAMLTLQNAPNDITEIGDLRWALLNGEDSFAKFDLQLDLQETPEGLRGGLEYASDLFDRTTIERLAGHFQTLLETIVSAPERKISALSVLDEKERNQLLIEWNATARTYPQAARLVHELFEDQAARRPDGVAVSFGDDVLNYRQLDERANRLAHHLIACGVAPDERVAVYMERSLDLFVALLAVMKAGGAYVPLDPDYPADRIAYMLGDSGPKAVLTQAVLRDRLPEVSIPVVVVDVDADIAARPAAKPMVPGLGPANLAYVIYTSGSTGLPKGAMNEHRAVVNRLLWIQDRYPLTAEDRLLQKTAFGFDVSVGEFFWPMLAGARLVMAPPGLHRDPDALADLIEQCGITAVHFVPSMLRIFLDRLSPDRCPSIRHLSCSGEELPMASVQRCRSLLPGATVLNLYGPTEAAIEVSAWDCRDSGAEHRVPIGRPIANTRLYVLDPRGQPVPIGVAGELFIGGTQVCRGYLNRPKLTHERFVPDPFAGRAGARMYKTGDLVRWLADGSLDYLGRNDFQVKLRGFRIELGEIEARLAACAGIGDAVVLAREDVPGDKRLVAYVTAEEGAELDIEALRHQLSVSLPDYMVPSAYVLLAELPLTPNGKMDRKALPAPDGNAYASRSYEAPAGADEVMLAAIWRELLGVEQVGVHDGFFDLGGHSLLATQLVARVRKDFGVELPLRVVFEARTVREQAGQIEELRRLKTGVAQPRLVALPRDERSLPSYAQERLWFLDQLDPGSAAYNLPLALRIEGPLDGSALERSLGALVLRHESLRTRFETVEGACVQVIDEAGRFVLSRLDLSGLTPPEQEAEVRRLATAEAARPFDLAAGPLLRSCLLRLSDADHVLLFTMHHIISDGWSMGVASRELGALYAAHVAGLPSPLAPLPVQYADYALWQRSWLTGEVLERQVAYWRERLIGAPTALELPADRPRPALSSHRGVRLPIALSASLSAELAKLAHREGATLFMVLLTVYQLLLSRWSGQEDVVVGSPIAGRTVLESEGLIGFFVNILAHRLNLSGDPSFTELLVRNREHVLGAFDHQEVPFERLVQELRIERDLSRQPLFQAMLTLQNAPNDITEIGDLRWALLNGEDSFAKFDLQLDLQETPEGLRGGLEYASDLFDRTTIERLAGHFQTLLETIVSAPERKISALSVLDEKERNQLLIEWNATARTYPQAARLVHELFEDQAARRPDGVAVSFGDDVLNYRQLDERANRLAHHLIACGVAPDERVAVYMERSLDLFVALLAVMKAGGAYVPLDPDYPADRIAYMLGDSGPKAVLTQAVLRDRLPEVSIPVVVVDVDADIAARPAAKPMVPGLGPANLAYVIYTSGSTGLPKGAMNEHRAVVNRLLWIQDRYPLTAEDRLLQKTAFGFDVSVGEFFWPMLAGARLVMAPPGLHRDPDALADLIEQCGITAVHFVPSMLRIFLDRLSPDRCPSIRHLSCSGEELPMASVQRCRSLLPGATVLNLYGPTEAAIEVSAWDCRDSGAEHRVPIGRPIANTRLYVLDPRGQPVPIGVAGELFIGGTQVCRGYLNRPKLTHERFVPDPFAGRAGARMYKTGDLVRWLADGSLDYLGRNDFQVKLRGFRIELGEIEARLAACAGIGDAVVLAREDVPGDKRLVAYVTAEEGAELDIEALRHQLSVGLPDYMVPSAYVLLAELPLSLNGKLDRKALPAPSQTAYAARGFVAPRNPTEKRLAEIFADVLDHERVGVDDDFFDLGGHSLLATQLVARVRDRFAVDLPLRAVFEAPIVRDMAARIDLLRRRGQEAGRVPLVAQARSNRSMPSYAQERLWFLDQLDPGSAAYNLPLALRIEGPLDGSALERSLGALVLRHESLRTRFEIVEGACVQVIDEAGTSALSRLDLSGLTPPEQEAEVRRLATAEAARPFDLAAGPLLRSCLLRLSDADHVLLLTMHHINSDGWSMGVASRELGALYAAFAAGLPSPLAPLELQYADYALWQRSWLTGEVLERQVAHWRERLAGAPAALELPTDRPRPPMPSYRGDRLPIALPASLSTELARLARREGATLYVVLLTAFQLLLSRLSAQDDVVVGSPIAGRTELASEGMIGLFVNTLAHRLDLSGNPTFQDLLARNREHVLGAFAHQEVPFERLVQELRIERDLSRQPLFQAMLTLQNVPDPVMEFGGLRSALLEGGPSMAKFDITLELMETPEGLQGGLQYATDLFDRATMERLADQYGTLLAGIVADPTGRIGALPLLNAAERRRIMEEFNPTAATDPEMRCVHQLFEEQAARTPEAIAVVFGDRQLSYGELNVRANQWAHHLIELGVGTDDRVAICVERSLEMVTGLLAILKAGGAFVPLDPSYPADRLAFMLKDCAPRVVLTQASLRPQLEGVTAPVLELDGDAGLIARLPGREPSVAGLAPSHLAYVIYTSGSTGQPKGVMVEHRGCVNLYSYYANKYMSGPQRVLVISSHAFDLTIKNIFATFMAASTVVLAPPTPHVGRELLEFIHEHEITIVNCAPSQFYDVVSDAGSGVAAVPPSRLKYVVLGGEQIKCERLLPWLALGSGPAFVNSYGPTEITDVAVDGVIGSISASGVAPIGRPIANTKIHILDTRMELVPVGIPGELYIGGAGVTRGYLNRPDLTAERFVSSPFVAGDRLYKTGDLGRWLPDGTIEYVGRNDFQVKVRGFRIELGEIEAKLTACVGIREAVVLAREDLPGDMRLVAYYTVEEGAAFTVDELRDRISTNLPDYMVPTAYVRLAALPINPNGKLDRNALPTPDGESRSSSRYEAPATATEEALASIWAESLGLERVGRHDDFFRLGGHSLLAVQVMARVKRHFGRSLPLAALFRYPDIASLGRALAEGEARSAEIAVPIQAEGEGAPLFALPGAGGNVLAFAWLSAAFDQARQAAGLGTLPFYALQAVGLDGAVPPPSSIEETAALNIVALQQIQPQGPYRLLGHSYGGVVAYEMTRQLQQAGETVSALVLLDSFAPETWRKENEEGVVDLLQELQTEIARLFPDRILDIDPAALLGLDHGQLSAVITAQLGRQGLVVDAQQLAAFLDVFQANVASYRAYRPQPLTRDAPVALLRVQTHADRGGQAIPEDYGWEQVLGRGPALRLIEGDHHSMLAPEQAGGLAASISELVAELCPVTNPKTPDDAAGNRRAASRSRRKST